MTNGILEVLRQLRVALLPMGLPIYYDFKPPTETNVCIVLSYMPLWEEKVYSVNDTVIFIYLPKTSGGTTDTQKIDEYCKYIANIVNTFNAESGMINFTKERAFSTSMMDNCTVTEYILKTISY